MNQLTALRGLILAGGKSARMGEDKSLIKYHDKPQREYLFELLQKFCDDVHVSCKSDEIVPKRLNPIADQFDMDSPLNGILSAFKMYPDVAWLAVAVDMPLVDEKAVQFLLEHRDPLKIGTCFRDSDGSLPEPLLTIWEPQAYPLLLKFFDDKRISPRQFLKDNNVKLLNVPDRNMLVNINTPQDLKIFRKEN